MEETRPLLSRNPLTRLRHRREVFWQITLPVVVVVVILLVLAILACWMTMGEASQWADISLIWLIIPLMFASLLVIAILSAAVYLTIRLIQELPYQFYRVHEWLVIAGLYVKDLDNKIVQPFLAVHAYTASTRALFRQLRRRS